MEGRSQTPLLVYEAKVNSIEGSKRYIGQTAVTFKFRWNNHKHSFNQAYKRHSTSLSSYIWQLKRRKINNDISWVTRSLAKPMDRGGKSFNLFLTEKTIIAGYKDDRYLNKRNEVMTRCCDGQSQSNLPDEWFCHETQCRRIKTVTFLVVYLEVYILPTLRPGKSQSLACWYYNGTK